ncbi:FMN-binding negative transcriptional regulator [Pseudomonas sp. DTU_2021_1001937_2_SI_NGA_ILE_001]|uniref:FMN-binding negative transcriptional regulator n=1 Tax=Pseudomonas sp. DTU_2021_1001937_2_SI_NGA_ILE_001 TaxID=3077589 RepID=UPI0028FC187E|nr:FMN-binding negative transcriptional regulator [Pseudomonas sp. DTU_2021_1001937_2_SI_NGA_ILE_001]WNW12541.1 FMN-binding negative transcriptional regulator [Pseudomonas sp. DTU_2021_1001937_2_SI_NGA_ILE_001]
MYTPTAFRDTDQYSQWQLIERCRLALLVTQGSQGLQATHLPLLLRRNEGPCGTLYGHLAKGNPQWRDLNAEAEVLVVFAGEDAYVSPSFYPSKAEHGKVVPTWNYLAVHAYGRPRLIDDSSGLRELLGALTERHEAGRAQPWSIDDAADEYIDKMLGAIVGFALPIDRLQGKRKLSQNRDAADIAGVRAGLAASHDPQDQRLAQLMSPQEPL